MTIEEDPECWINVADAIVAGCRRIILFGPPGLGKTHTGLNAFKEVSRFPARRLVCNEDMTASDVVGCYQIGENGQFVWKDGNVLSAWKEGSVVVADEVDRASGDVLSLLLAMFDSPESASWTHPSTGERFTPHPDFTVVMTTNVEDMEELPTALKDRFPVAIRINRPHPSALAELSEDLRQAAALSGDRHGSERISLRAWREFDRMRTNLLVKYEDKMVAEDRAAEIIFRELKHDVLAAIRVNSVTA